MLCAGVAENANQPTFYVESVFGLKSVGYEEKEKGQTLNFEDLSNVAPAGIELLNLWNDFRKVVQFIDDNQTWLRPLMDRVAANKKAEEK